MAKLLKHFGIGGKKYNPSSSQQTDYSSASLKSNSVNELACNTKYCSNNCLSGNTPASINTKHKGCSNSKSDYDTRSLKLRSDECNKKQKPPSSTTEKFKALGRSSKETTQYSSKTVKSKSREGETKSKHKKISFSNLIHSADHHHTKVASIDASEASSPIVPEILEEYSNPLDLALEKDPLTIDDDYSTPYDQVDKFLADAKNSKKEMPNGIVTVINRTKNSTNTRNVPKVISVKPVNNNNTSSNHTTSTTTTTTPTNIKTTNTTITTHTNTATLNTTAALISTSNTTSTTTAPSTTNTSSTTSSSTIPTTSTTSNTDEQNIEGDEVMKEMVIKKNDEVKGDDALCLSGGDVSKTIGGDGGVALGLNNEDEVVVLGDDDVVVSKSESVVVRSDGGNDDDEEDDDDDGIKKIAPEEITNDNDDTTKKLSGDDDDDNNTAALLATDPMVGSQSYGTSGGSVTVVTTNNYHDLKPVIVLNQLQIDQSDHFIAPSNNQSNNSATLSNNKSISTTSTATTCQKTLDLKAANETKEDSNQSEGLLRHNNQSGVATSRPKSDGVLIAPGRNKSYTKNRNNNNNINNINNNIVNKFSNNIRIAKKKTSLEASKTLNKNHTTSNHQKLLHTTTTSHHNHSLSSSHHHSNSHQNHHPHHNSSSQNHSVAQNTIHNHSSNHHNHTNHSHSSDSDSIEAPLEQNNWFHGCISRLDAEKLLSKQSTGTYLVRVSESNNNDFSLSLKSRSGFLHIKIVQDTTTSQYILGQFSQPFKHICVLVEHYTTNQLPIKGNDGLTLSNPLVVAVEVGGGGGA